MYKRLPMEFQKKSPNKLKRIFDRCPKELGWFKRLLNKKIKAIPKNIAKTYPKKLANQSPKSLLKFSTKSLKKK